MSAKPSDELTFLMVKPDAVRRGLTGEIIRRIEATGLKIVSLKMVQADREKVSGFYPNDNHWITRLGEKTLSTYAKYGYDAIEELGTDKAEEIGPMVRKWLLDFMTSGPVIPMVIKGVHAVTKVRKLIGDTMPANADFGTIRGDFAIDSAAAANRDKRAVFNLVHATETAEEAAKEIGHWFLASEITEYRSADDEIMSPE